MAGLAVYDIAPIEDRVDELISLVARSSDVAASIDGKALAQSGNLGGFIKQILDKLQLSGSDDEIDGLFMLLFSFLKDLSMDDVKELANRVSTLLVSGIPSDLKGTSARLRALVNLYNTLNDAQYKSERLSTLRAIISFATNTKQVDLLASLFATSGSWVSKWGLTEQQARELFLLSSSALEKASDAEGAQGFLIRYLSTFENDAAAIDDEVLQHARDAALGYVKAPALSQRSALAQLAAVKALDKDARYSQLYRLLTIFASGTLSDYNVFVQANADAIAKLGVDAERSVETMRLFTLVSLASTKTTLDFTAIGEALQTPTSEVESWVVRAVTRGLLDARVDQAASIVTVSRCLTREFGATQWTALHEKLQVWRDNVGTLLATIEGRAAAAATL